MPATETATETQIETQQSQIRSTNIFDRAIIITLSITRPGNARKLSNSLVEVDADKSMLRVSKELLDSPELEAIAKLDREIRKFIVDLALPSPLGEGSYLMPIVFVKNVTEQLAQFYATRQQLVEAAVRAYPERKEEARIRLRSAYNEMDYPHEDRFRAAFGLTWRYTTFGPPAVLQSISEEIFANEHEKYRRQLQDNLTEINSVLTIGFKQLVDRLVERLTPGEEGKAKRFKKSTVEAFDEFFATFSARNLGDNEQLNELVNKARQIMHNVTPEAIRQSADVRTYLQTNMAQIQATLETMTVNTTTRMVVNDDTEDAT